LVFIYYLFVRIFILFLLFFAVFGSSALGENTSAAESYEKLRSSYFSLRNTDVDLARLTDWKNLGVSLEGFVEKNSQDKNAPLALFNAASLYEYLYRQLRKDSYLEKTQSLLDRFINSYPEHALADDVLIKSGDIFLYFLQQKVWAEQYYRRVIRDYPDGDMYEVARFRLRSLNSAMEETMEESGNDAEVKTSMEEPATKTDPSLVIVIDPGHGGEDLGAVGQGGLLEKDVVLAVALELEKLLQEELGATVRLTRRTDVFVPLMERTAFANDFEAKIFISLHANASEKGNLSGFETYYLDNTGNKASKRLAERENRSLEFEESMEDLHFILSDLIQTSKLEQSVTLANFVQKSTVASLQRKWNNIKDLGVKRAPFYVLVGAHMPCILVEMFFIDSPQDGPRLADPAFRRGIARGLFEGIQKYLDNTE